jgi:vacuolar-type H+-ATPase catalytic subunit A/Vma1
MKKIWFVLLSVLMLCAVSPAAGQSSQDDIYASGRQFEQWAKNLSEFVKDVRFNEEDVQSLLNLWDDFTAVGEEEAEEDEEEFLDFNTILYDKAYRSWADSKGIDGEMWLKKTMRIMAMVMRSSIEANSSSQDQFDLKSQLEELEEMRPQMDEEAYQQMKQAMEAGAAAMQGLNESYKYLPVPTDSEKMLLAKYNDQLMNLE